MDSLLKDNEKNVLCESFVIRLSPHHELLGKLIACLFLNKDTTEICSSWERWHTGLWGLGWSFDILSTFSQVLHIMFKYFLFAFSLLFKRKYMVLETFNQGNQYWLLCPDYIAYFLSVLLCFCVCVSIIQQSESDKHTHTHILDSIPI